MRKYWIAMVAACLITTAADIYNVELPKPWSLIVLFALVYGFLGVLAGDLGEAAAKGWLKITQARHDELVNKIQPEEEEDGVRIIGMDQLELSPEEEEALVTAIMKGIPEMKDRPATPGCECPRCKMIRAKEAGANAPTTDTKH